LVFENNSLGKPVFQKSGLRIWWKIRFCYYYWFLGRWFRKTCFFINLIHQFDGKFGFVIIIGFRGWWFRKTSFFCKLVLRRQSGNILWEDLWKIVLWNRFSSLISCVAKHFVAISGNWFIMRFSSNNCIKPVLIYYIVVFEIVVLILIDQNNILSEFLKKSSRNLFFIRILITSRKFQLSW